jgi:hypothetical protein
MSIIMSINSFMIYASHQILSDEQIKACELDGCIWGLGGGLLLLVGKPEGKNNLQVKGNGMAGVDWINLA